MGVAGCGKTTVGSMVAGGLGVPFVDGDDLHPVSNISKMAAGMPLTDADRLPWLADVGEWLAARSSGVVACSALRRSYRDAIRRLVPDLVVVHLDAPSAVLRARIVERSARSTHFMGADMLDSQVASLEPLGDDEVGVTIDVTHGAPQLAARLVLDYIAARPMPA